MEISELAADVGGGGGPRGPGDAAAAEGVPRARGALRRAFARTTGALLAIALLAGTLVGFAAQPAEALPRGETVSFPGGVTISNFVMPGGKRAYCIEVSMREPSGYASGGGRRTSLPGREGMFPAWGDTEGMRQMNYLIDTHGQSRDAWTAAAVQLTIWRMRERFTQANAQLNRTVAALETSKRGRDLIAKSDALYADAKRRAKAPSKPRAVSAEGFRLDVDPSGVPGRYRISYPKGTTKLSVVGAKFVRNGLSTLNVPGDSASVRYADLVAGAKQIEATGSWTAQGTPGWDAALHVFNTTTAAGASAQRVAVATGASQLARISGDFPRLTAEPEPKPGPPTASSQAQPSAEVGGTMIDTLIVSPAVGRKTVVWPEAVADFTAYLQPEAGSVKYTDKWEPVLGEPYDAQAEDPKTGEPLWTEWWAGPTGEPLLDANGDRIPRFGADGSPTAGTAADGTEYPVRLSGPSGEPGEPGEVVLSILREPVMEKRRDPVRWTEAELAGMTEADRCVAQPVHREAGIPVPAVGEYRTRPVEVRSPGTVHWVERVASPAGQHHVGACGIANETTRVGQPGVVTLAQPDAVVGDRIADVATVSGSLAPNAKYELRFEAFGSGASGTEHGRPVCDAESRIFRSDAVQVTGPGEYRSPEFTVLWEHGTRIWWVETLSIETASGSRVLHRGACGLGNETTTIERPEVRTKALASAAVGDPLTDTAIVGGGIAENAGARWEVGFEAYRAAHRQSENLAENVRDGEEQVEVPVCEPGNRLFATEPSRVTGPGEIVSEAVEAEPEWVGTIWWVETLWLVQGEKRTPVHRGECGLPHETTELAGPEVVTSADEFVAVGGRMRDTAKVTGPLSKREGAVHEIVFAGYRGDAERTGTDAAECTDENLLFTTEPVEVTGQGDVRSPEVTALPEYGETVWWVETLRMRVGENERVLHRGACGLTGETTTQQFPVVRTESAGTVTAGEEMFDTAIVGGVFPKREGLEFRVVFRAYEREDGEEMVCSPQAELRRFADLEGVAVTGPGRYESRRVRTTAEDIGLGGYVETLVMIEGGEEHTVAVGACGATDERFGIVAAPERPLARTGGEGDGVLLIGAGGLLLAGAGVMLPRFVRRRAKGGSEG